MCAHPFEKHQHGARPGTPTEQLQAYIAKLGRHRPNGPYEVLTKFHKERLRQNMLDMATRSLQSRRIPTSLSNSLTGGARHPLPSRNSGSPEAMRAFGDRYNRWRSAYEAGLAGDAMPTDPEEEQNN